MVFVVLFIFKYIILLVIKLLKNGKDKYFQIFGFLSGDINTKYLRINTKN